MSKRPRFTAEHVTNPLHAPSIARARESAATGQEMRLPMVDGHIGGVTEKVKGKSPIPFGRKKYRNIPCEVNGEKYDSKLEAKVHGDLIRGFCKERIIRQVSIPLGGKRIRPDFLVITDHFEDGSFRGFFADAKGKATRDWEAKAAWLLDKHGIKIRLIKK